MAEETKNSVIAIFLIGFAAISILASFGKAGPAGSLMHAGLSAVLGSGYYFIPLLAFIIAVFLLASAKKKFLGVTFLGAALFILSGLGLLDVLAPGKGGFIGSFVGSIEYLFGYTAAIIINLTTLIASVLIMLNIPLSLTAKKESEEDAEENEKADEKEIKTTSSKNQVEVLSQEPEPVKKTESVPDAAPQTYIESRNDENENAYSPKKQFKASYKNFPDYTPPPLSLLKSSIEKPASGDLRASANIIKRTLESFGIPVEMGEINIGPKVTRYTLKPAEGIKLSRITALNQDLALALAAHPIRIEAPIPGKSLVGIEVPNKSAAIVRLGSLMAYEDFQKSGPLTIVLGRDVTGEPVLADIAKMPHLLIAGSTGSGKSVVIHSILVSLLYKNSPATLKLVLIDPKRVELTAYDGIPHLLSTVITSPKKVMGVLRWAIQEMEERYETLQESGSRDIASYNKKAKEPLPAILIVIDELADIMSAYGREVESSIVRLAQMARATGIHLILSTQRPSVEIVTGLIKANITNRIALQVGSQVDSRTILDTAGAEKLLGGGDMLFISNELSKPRRIQGAFISESEIKAVAEFLRSNNARTEPQQDFESKEPALSNFESFDAWEENYDELYPQAVQVVREAKKASASFLQRRLKIGYARAARLLDMMEERGIVGPGEGAKPREVYGIEETDNSNA